MLKILKMLKMLLFVRIGGRPAGEIPLSVAHTEPVFKTMWIQSKTGSEFFTASSDGTVSTMSTITLACPLSTRASNEDYPKVGEDFTITEKDPTFKTLFRNYAK